MLRVNESACLAANSQTELLLKEIVETGGQT